MCIRVSLLTYINQVIQVINKNKPTMPESDNREQPPTAVTLRGITPTDDELKILFAMLENLKAPIEANWGEAAKSCGVEDREVFKLMCSLLCTKYSIPCGIQGHTIASPGASSASPAPAANLGASSPAAAASPAAPGGTPPASPGSTTTSGSGSAGDFSDASDETDATMVEEPLDLVARAIAAAAGGDREYDPRLGY